LQFCDDVLSDFRAIFHDASNGVFTHAHTPGKFLLCFYAMVPLQLIEGGGENIIP
jgi:hypothetical protein